MYMLELCHNLIGDAVDALFVCAHVDAENQVSNCPKAVEAVSLHSSVLSGRRSLLTGSLCVRTQQFSTPESEGDVLLSLSI